MWLISGALALLAAISDHVRPINTFIFHAGTVLALSDKNQSTESTDGECASFQIGMFWGVIEE